MPAIGFEGFQPDLDLVTDIQGAAIFPLVDGDQALALEAHVHDHVVARPADDVPGQNRAGGEVLVVSLGHPTDCVEVSVARQHRCQFRIDSDPLPVQLVNKNVIYHRILFLPQACQVRSCALRCGASRSAHA